MDSATILALWNVLLCLFILYFPGIVCGVITIICLKTKKKILGIVAGIATLALVLISSLILYWVVDFMMSW